MDKIKKKFFSFLFFFFFSLFHSRLSFRGTLTEIEAEGPCKGVESRFRILATNILLHGANDTMAEDHLQLDGQLGGNGEESSGSLCSGGVVVDGLS